MLADRHNRRNRRTLGRLLLPVVAVCIASSLALRGTRITSPFSHPSPGAETRAMVILVGGGTGRVGSAAVKTLSAKGATVKVLARDLSSDKAKTLEGLSGVTLVKGDFSDPASLKAAFDGVTRAYLGCSNFEGQVEAEQAFIDAAATSGSCKYLVKLGTCGTEGYTGLESEIQYGRYHAQIENHLDKSGLQWTVLRPNWFMQNHMADIFATLPAGIIAYPVSASTKARMIDTRDVGDVAAALLLLSNPSSHHAKKYDVCGPDSVSCEDLVAFYAKELGRPIAAVPTSSADWVANVEKAGIPTWLANAILVNFEKFWALGKLDYGSSDAVVELAKPARTMESWIKEHAVMSPPPAGP
eukprot:TRINITY_DN31049_c0_g1_i1.p1 TRINITY_DN31049_c0_g1~~TRINITY_DN31049_c0_g1_i1.p1  ORF type:complete len:356 (+),score=54.71 TRINITY_DN31049_c0_g1_i1:295-1362(+)